MSPSDDLRVRIAEALDELTWEARIDAAMAVARAYAAEQVRAAANDFIADRHERRVLFEHADTIEANPGWDG